MTQQIGGYPPYPASGAPAGQPTTQVARNEAADVGRTAADAGRQVAGTAAEQAGNVAQEVKTQARDFVGEARGQVQDQARTGQQKAAEGIRALSRELREMADGGQQRGPVSQVARQAADRADDLSTWLDEREPGDVVEEVRSFARRRPGVFLLGMAVAGVVVGRFTRGAVDAARAESGPPTQRAYGEPGYGQAVYGEPGYARTPGVPLPPYDGPNGPGVRQGGPPPVTSGPAGPGVRPGGPPPGAPPVPYDAPTPPAGYPPTHAAPAPHPADQVSAGRAYDPDPLAAPAEPVGRPAGPVGEYGDEIGRTGERRVAGHDELLDDSYRPGGEDFR